jgi:hypothetical protein
MNSLFKKIKPRHLSSNPVTQRELAPQAYWDDPRWAKALFLRKDGQHPEANALLEQLHQDHGVD